MLEGSEVTYYPHPDGQTGGQCGVHMCLCYTRGGFVFVCFVPFSCGWFMGMKVSVLNRTPTLVWCGERDAYTHPATSATSGAQYGTRRITPAALRNLPPCDATTPAQVTIQAAYCPRASPTRLSAVCSAGSALVWAGRACSQLLVSPPPLRFALSSGRHSSSSHHPL
ncbi:uncharacterized protein LOC143297764 [Babylonia areolata]|uniref:uncharacterized protein LOC143297764 n=1 Tax=Babylonia areolata TaxID=304850 RepID=UPI003FCF10F3